MTDPGKVKEKFIINETQMQVRKRVRLYTLVAEGINRCGFRKKSKKTGLLNNFPVYFRIVVDETLSNI
jgi:hypothetical protein